MLYEVIALVSFFIAGYLLGYIIGFNIGYRECDRGYNDSDKHSS